MAGIKMKSSHVSNSNSSATVSGTLPRSAAVSKTSRSSVIRLNSWYAPYAPEFSNVLRLVEDDTAALRHQRRETCECRSANCEVQSVQLS